LTAVDTTYGMEDYPRNTIYGVYLVEGDTPIKQFAIRYKYFYNFVIKLNVSLVLTLSCLFEIYEI